MDEETATATVAGCAQVFDLHALKDFAADKRVRKMLFKTDQLWSEIACYEPGQSTVVSFSVPPARLAFSDRSMRRVVEPGRLELWIGDAQTRESQTALTLVGPVHLVGGDDERMTVTTAS